MPFRKVFISAYGYLTNPYALSIKWNGTVSRRK